MQLDSTDALAALAASLAFARAVKDCKGVLLLRATTYPRGAVGGASGLPLAAAMAAIAYAHSIDADPTLLSVAWINLATMGVQWAMTKRSHPGSDNFDCKLPSGRGQDE